MKLLVRLATFLSFLGLVHGTCEFPAEIQKEFFIQRVGSHTLILTKTGWTQTNPSVSLTCIDDVFGVQDNYLLQDASSNLFCANIVYNKGTPAPAILFTMKSVIAGSLITECNTVLNSANPTYTIAIAKSGSGYDTANWICPQSLPMGNMYSKPFFDSSSNDYCTEVVPAVAASTAEGLAKSVKMGSCNIPTAIAGATFDKPFNRDLQCVEYFQTKDLYGYSLTFTLMIAATDIGSGDYDIYCSVFDLHVEKDANGNNREGIKWSFNVEDQATPMCRQDMTPDKVSDASPKYRAVKTLQNYCETGTCQNGANCTPDKISPSNDVRPTLTYKCTCAPGFTGTNCQTDIDDCNPDPCLNGGTCRDGVQAYTCDCTSQYTGTRCETKLCALPADWQGKNWFVGGTNYNIVYGATQSTLTTASPDVRNCVAELSDANGYTYFTQATSTAATTLTANACAGGKKINNVLVSFHSPALASAPTTSTCKTTVDGSFFVYAYFENKAALTAQNCGFPSGRFRTIVSTDGNANQCANDQTFTDITANPTKLDPNACAAVTPVDATSPFRGDLTCVGQLTNTDVFPGTTAPDMLLLSWDDSGTTRYYCARKSVDATGVSLSFNTENPDDTKCTRTATATFVDANNKHIKLLPDECKSLTTSPTCQNGGTCADSVDVTGNKAAYTCTCAAGFTGTNCETNINDCTPNPCQNGGTCNDKTQGFDCTCAINYSGTLCEIFNDCASAPCQNGGTCSDIGDTFKCTCPSGFTGNVCQTPIEECDSNPCQNGGTCNETPPPATGYTCTCPIGFTGTHCETNINECQSDPCHNGGICMDRVNGYYCNCTDPGFIGILCEQKDECSSNPCKNGGTCEDDLDFYRCLCPAGYNGTDCGVVANFCAPDPCANGAACQAVAPQQQCQTTTASYQCSCPQNYYGQKCTLFDSCSSNPCKNGGTCTRNDDTTGYTCKCKAGNSGSNCDSGGIHLNTVALVLIVLIALLVLAVIIVFAFMMARRHREHEKALNEQLSRQGSRKYASAWKPDHQPTHI